MYARAINWYLQRITGAALLVLLVMHFWVEHFAASVTASPNGLTYEIVQQRFFHNPWFVGVDIAFLIFALYHGLNGLRNIILDYGAIGKRGGQAVTAILIVVGLLWAWWGVDAFSGHNLTSKPEQTASVTSAR